MSERTYPDRGTRPLVTICAMSATVMSALDSTIANVALPHMQGSISASSDEMTWVLTSYIVGSAIFIPLCGWLADRFGRKRVMLASVLGFTLTSMLCGLATNLDEIVLFRLAQGVCGAGLVPVSQAILIDINPPEKQSQALAIWGMGAIIGPIAGPILGGWLTDNLSWRWVFYVNVPIGVLTLFGLWAFLTDREREPASRLDFFGFALLALAVGALQVMLDRGQQQGWFSSTEICVEAALAVFFLYAFIVQTLTAPEPFVDLGLFADRNFTFGVFFGFFIGVSLFSVLALLPTMLQSLLGYPVVLTGMVGAPRGIGTFFSMMLVSVLIRRVSPRLLVIVGLALVSLSMFMMAGYSLQMDWRLVALSGLVSGVGNGFAFVPLSTITFATLKPRYLNEGTSMYTLIRNLGSAVGISLIQAVTVRNAATVHARLVEGVRPDNPVMALRRPDFDFGMPSAIAGLNGEITRQASMVSYIDAFRLVAIVILAIMPLVLLMRPPQRGRGAPKVHVD